jgi:hypothetical protein
MRHPIRRLVVLMAVAIAAPLHAQNAISFAPSDSVPLSVDTARAATVVAAPVVSKSVAPGASLTGLRAGVHANETSRPAQPNFQAAHANLGQARAMMVVGVAGLIAGAIIGGTPGTIIMVGGAVVGLLGLYDYVQ